MGKSFLASIGIFSVYTYFKSKFFMNNLTYVSEEEFNGNVELQFGVELLVSMILGMCIARI